MGSERDNVTKELQVILDGIYNDKRITESERKMFIMQGLVIYITRRDHRIWNDGYKKGREANGKGAN